MSSGRAEKKRIKKQWYEKMYKWYEDQRNKKTSVSQTISKKAKEILADLDTNKSIKSRTLENWVSSFRKYYNIEHPRGINKDTFKTKRRKQWEKLMSEWLEKHKNEKKVVTQKMLLNKAKEIKDLIDDTNCIKSEKTVMVHWLSEFKKDHNLNIRPLYKIKSKYMQLQEKLFNWLLEKVLKKQQILSGTILMERLKDEIPKLIRECNHNKPPQISIWLERFINCHEVLTKPDIIKNFIHEEDKTNQSDKNVDKQLFYWLLKQKKSENTISLRMLIDKSIELLEAFDESENIKEESWPSKIKGRYVAEDYSCTPETSSKASSKTLSNRAYKSGEIDQVIVGTSKSMKRKIEEDAVSEEISSNPTKKFKTKEEERILPDNKKLPYDRALWQRKKFPHHYNMSNRAQKSDETDDQAIAETLKSTKNVIEEDAASEEIPSSLTKKSRTEEKEGTPPEMLMTKKKKFKGKFILLDEQLFNSLLRWITLNKKQIIKKKKTSIELHEMLKDELTRLIPLYGGPKSRDKDVWLDDFTKCHEILTKLDNLKDLIQRRNETNQSENLDEQLFYWLLKRKKKLESIISLDLLKEKTMELLEAFDGPENIKEESWPGKIKDRYIPKD